MKRFHLLLILILSVLISFSACNEKESPIGLGLQDPATLYDGIHETVIVNAASFRDDSLTTSFYSTPVIGSYRDRTMGSVTGIFFTQIGMSDENGIVFDEHCNIDSVILSFAVSEIYPTRILRDNSWMHLSVDQLRDPMPSDSTYYFFNNLPIGRNNFFQGTARVQKKDSANVISMKLNSNVYKLFENQSYPDNESFLKASKGIRVSMKSDGVPTMISLNLAAAATKLTLYYRYITPGNDTISETKDFKVGSDMTHFNRFEHTFSGNLASFSHSSDSIPGDRYLYFSPLGGTFVKLDFNDYVAAFHEAHPYAIIHYAEIILPVSDISDNDHPSKIIARLDRGEGNYVPDLLDAFTYQGFDGAYHHDSQGYRLRITQHFQNAVSKGKDDGTLLFLNTRRYSPRRVIINGTDPVKTNGNPCRIEFVYSEPQI